MPPVRNSDSSSPAEPLNRPLFPASSLAAEMQTASRNRASTGDTSAPIRRRRNGAGRRSLLQIAICVAAIFVASSTIAQASAGVSPALRVRPACPPTVRPFAVFVTEAARRFHIPESWIRAVMRVESFGDARAVSPKGAIGLMQVMPNTYAELRVRHRLGVDPCDPRNNILAGAAYLREMLDRYGAPGFLAAYNAGPARYDEHLIKGRPLPGETQDYVAKLAPAIGVQRADQKSAAFDLFAWLNAALFPPLADSSPGAVLLAVRPQPDRSSAIRHVVDLSALAPSSDGLFVRLAVETGSR
jgi:soluble lytic murein transglycosylase-like protein